MTEFVTSKDGTKIAYDRIGPLLSPPSPKDSQT